MSSAGYHLATHTADVSAGLCAADASAKGEQPGLDLVDQAWVGTPMPDCPTVPGAQSSPAPDLHQWSRLPVSPWCMCLVSGHAEISRSASAASGLPASEVFSTAEAESGGVCRSIGRMWQLLCRQQSGRTEAASGVVL